MKHGDMSSWNPGDEEIGGIRSVGGGSGLRGCGFILSLPKGLSVAGWLRHPGARPSARSQHRAILAPDCARKPGGRTQVQPARRVPRLASRLARQLAFLRMPMAAHGVPLLKLGFDGASCTAPPSAMFAATVRSASHPAASGGGPRGDGSPFASPAVRRSPAGGARPASAMRFRRFGS